MGHDEASAVAYAARSISDAELVKGLLITEGIPAIIDNESSIAMLDGIVSHQTGINVLVPASEVERSIAIIAQAKEVGHLAEAESEEE